MQGRNLPRSYVVADGSAAELLIPRRWFDSTRPHVIASGPGSAFPKHAQRVRLPPMTLPPWRRIAGSPSKAASRVRVLAGRPRGCRSMEGPVAYTHKMGVRFSPPVLWCCRSVVGRLVVCEFTGVRFSPAPPGPVKSTVDGSPYQRAVSVRIVHRVPRGRDGTWNTYSFVPIATVK